MWKVIPFELVPPADTIRDGLAGMDMSRWHGKNQAAGSYRSLTILTEANGSEYRRLWPSPLKFTQPRPPKG